MMTPELLSHRDLATPVPIWSFRFGCVFPDIPYFAHFTKKLIKHLLKKDVLGANRWGGIFHQEGILQMVNSYIDSVEAKRMERSEIFESFLKGLIMHNYIDTHTHPLITEMAKELSFRDSVSREYAHLYIEKVQFLSLQKQLYGSTGFGKIHFLKNRNILPSPFRAFSLAELIGYIDITIKDSYSESPGKIKLLYWLFSTYYYSIVMSTPPARIEANFRQSDGPIYYNEDFRDRLNKAILEGFDATIFFSNIIRDRLKDRFIPQKLD